MFKIINKDLIKVDQRKKNKIARGQKHYNEARVMNLEIIKKKNETWVVKQFDKEFTQLCRLDLDIFQDLKRDKNSVKKKIIALFISGPSMPSFISGSIISTQWFVSPQISSCVSLDSR